MAEKKNLCAPISIELHAKVREEQERLGQILSEYVEQVLREHFEGRSKNMWIQQEKMHRRYRSTSDISWMKTKQESN